jgi:thiamine pyrophosphokinase
MRRSKTLPGSGGGFFLHSIVVANGELSVPDHILPDGKDGAMVIAVDGGFKHCQDLGLQVDLLIGDFDSIDPAEIEILQSSAVEIIRHPPEKDETDLELALLEAVKRGAQKITILGGLGRRFDMTIANLGLLVLPGLQDIKVEFWHHGQRIWLIHPPGDDIEGKTGDTLSLLPFNGMASGIHTENLAYPLKGESLVLGPARGVSNVLSGNKARVSLEEGCLLAIWTEGRA